MTARVREDQMLHAPTRRGREAKKALELFLGFHRTMRTGRKEGEGCLSSSEKVSADLSPIWVDLLAFFLGQETAFERLFDCRVSVVFFFHSQRES